MSDNNQAYDPSAPEGDGRGAGQYVTKKDFKVFGIAFLVLGAILAPIYMYGMKQSQSSRCKTYISAIAKAIEGYATENDDRLPPVFRTAEDGSGAPGLGANGLPFTFASVINGYLSNRASFTCPAALAEENVQTEHPESSQKRLVTSYGMYLPYGGFLRSVIPDPDQTIIVAETSNYGAKGTYNPVPYKNGSGKVVASDGFAIGWNNSNDMPDKETGYVTRLAFPKTGDGNFSDQSETRHPNGIHAITAQGQLVTLTGANAQVQIQKSTGLPVGIWTFPPK